MKHLVSIIILLTIACCSRNNYVKEIKVIEEVEIIKEVVAIEVQDNIEIDSTSNSQESTKDIEGSEPRKNTIAANPTILLPVRHDKELIFYQANGSEKFRVKGYTFASRRELDFDCFNDGLCALQKGRHGDDDFEIHYIDTSGNVLIDLGGNSSQRFSEGMAGVYDRESKEYYFINTRGERVFETNGSPDGYFTDGMIIVQNAMEDSLSYLDKTGKVCFKKSRKNTSSDPKRTGYSNGLALFRSVLFKYDCSYINKKGEVVIKGNYRNPQKFSEGLASVEIDNSTLGFIDTLGNIEFTLKSKKYRSFSDELAAVKSDYKWGFVNKKGNWAIKPIYREVQDFDNGYAAVKDDLYWTIIDKSGKIVFQDSLVNYMEYIGDEIVFVNYYGENNYAYLKMDNSIRITPKPEYIQFTDFEIANKYPLDFIKSFDCHPYNTRVGKKDWRRGNYFRNSDKNRMRSNIDSFPIELLKYIHLIELNLSYNRIDTIPTEINRLVKLREINLENNRFESFPNSLHSLKELTRIDLSFNRISSLPKEGLIFDNVKYLSIIGNPIAEDSLQQENFKLSFPNARIIFDLEDVRADVKSR